MKGSKSDHALMYYRDQILHLMSGARQKVLSHPPTKLNPYHFIEASTFTVPSPQLLLGDS